MTKLDKLIAGKDYIIKAYLDGDSNGCGCYDYSTIVDATEYYYRLLAEVSPKRIIKESI